MMIDKMMVSDVVLSLMSVDQIAKISEAVERRAASMPAWRAGQMFVDDYPARDGSVVRFVLVYGSTTMRVGLKSAMRFYSPVVRDGNHRISLGETASVEPEKQSGVTHLPGEFVPFTP
jgi:hypothetical protein